MGKLTRRVLSFVLSFLLVFSLWTPTIAKAADAEAQSSNEVVIAVGETTTLKASGWGFMTTWTSSDTNVATVSNKGIVTGVAPGTATVAATTKNFFGAGTTREYYVRVVEKEEIEAIQVKKGESVSLPSPGESGTTTWTSSDTSIATVTDDGTVTGISAGTVTITATTKSGGIKIWFFIWGETTTITKYVVEVIDDGETPNPEPEIYTVTFETNGGSSIESQAVEEGNTVLKPADPTKEGYTFDGWYSDEALSTIYDFGTPVTEDITLYAKWDEVRATIYTVTFETNGGNMIEPQTVEEGNTATKPEDPEKEGYTFEGWYEDEELINVYDFETPVTANITLYAKWDEVNDTGIYTVSFETSGGSVISDQAVYAGDCVIQPQNPVKEGYVFAGWYSDQELTEEYDFTTPVEKDFTLYAAWNDADVVIDLKLDTEDKTECKRNISGSITSNLTIEKVYYEFKSENKNEESDISLSDDFTFNIDVLLEDGTNTLTVYVDTVDGSTTSKSVSMAFDEGSTVDYSKVDQIYDPDDPRIVTKPIDDPEDSSTTFVTNIVNLFFRSDSSFDERVTFVEETLGGSVAGYLNTVDMMQAWLPETLISVNGYDGTLKLEDITESELNVYAEAVADVYDIVEDAYIDYIYEENFEIITDDPWDGSFDSNRSGLRSPDTFTGNDWWINYVNFPEAWEYNSYYNCDYLTNVEVGIFDGGFLTSHEELTGKISVVSDEDSSHYHGTHVAGIIAATADNRVGLAGGTYNQASVFAYDGLSSESSSFATTAKFAGLNSTVKAGAQVINFSIGSAGNVNSPNIKSDDRIRKEGQVSSRYIGNLLKEGYDFIVVQSAGNGGIDSPNNGGFASISLGNCAVVEGVSAEEIVSRVLIVSAIDENGTMADFSCGGSSGTNAIAAPGIDVFSCGVSSNSSYAYMSGTSMAAPVVTAGCSVVWSVNYGLNGAEVVDLIMNNTNGTATTNESSNTTGGMGILDVEAAVEAAIQTLPTYYGTIMDAVTGDSIYASVKIHKGGQNGVLVGKEEVYNTDSNGKFTLPKLPGASYTLEVSAEGYVTSYVNIYTLSMVSDPVNLGTIGLTPEMDENEYRMILRWTGEPSDLDSHLVATTSDGDSYHVYYKDRDPSPAYANLDRDDTDYEGPETITIFQFSQLKNIKYAIHDFTNRQSTSSNVMSNSGAYVEVYKGSELLETFEVPLNTDGTEWDVFAFDANGNIVPMNQMKYCSDPDYVLSSSTAEEVAEVSTYSLDNDEKEYNTVS